MLTRGVEMNACFFFLNTRKNKFTGKSMFNIGFLLFIFHFKLTLYVCFYSGCWAEIWGSELC